MYSADTIYSTATQVQRQYLADAEQHRLMVAARRRNRRSRRNGRPRQ